MVQETEVSRRCNPHGLLEGEVFLHSRRAFAFIEFVGPVLVQEFVDYQVASHQCDQQL